MPCECMIYESRGQKSIPWSYITNNYQGEKDTYPRSEQLLHKNIQA